MEIWKPIKNYEGSYEVSNLGRVKSLERYVKHSRGGRQILKERILSPRMSKTYDSFSLCFKGKPKTHYIHALVMDAFHPKKRPKGYVIDHINRNCRDNRIENLRYCTQRENINNREVISKAGYVGVSINPSNYEKPYRARIRIGNKMKELGSYHTALEASKKYINEKRNLKNEQHNNR